MAQPTESQTTLGANVRESETVINYPVNLSKLISVRNKVVFVRDSENGTFQTKLTLNNKSSQYVTYAVRPSNREKFRIQRKVGFIPPRQSLELVISTVPISAFQDISKEYFGIFALPVYDKRQLEKNTLNLLWRAQGTKMFPYEAAEFHRISYILPKSDEYFNDLPIIGRIAAMSHIGRRSLPKSGEDMAYDDKPVDEETFFLNWPPPTGDPTEDATMELLTKDWNLLTSRINTQTTNILDGLKTIFGIGISGATTLAAFWCLYSSNAPPFVFGLGDDNRASSDSSHSQAKSGWFSWTGL